MRFLVDMPLSPRLCEWLQEQGHDAVHAFHLGLARAPDQTILAQAREDQRVVITADLDYPRLLALTQSTAPGLILLRGGDYSEAEVRERLAALFNAVPVEALPNSVVVIERARIRRRRLPLQPS